MQKLPAILLAACADPNQQAKPAAHLEM